ncbi:NUDIX domain-containing protein [Deinococcus sp. HMF7620]|uniref:NUDIX domain-containing protein n=1 Tax=Deinococcus arboris TaxID=2682977 RepID=A0A7C9HQZ8_9DEIO|nr:NUDIX domain-containing protein [Deinococcus arboris]MVN86569.1 NUDIX domain-containing protein [Deinococcus arboris]
MSFQLVAWLAVQDGAGRLLLGRRDGSSYAHGLWGLPGGRVERGESLAQTAARETLEEVDLVVHPDDLTCLGACRYDLDSTQGLDVFFLARTWEGEARPLDKTSEVAWFAPDRLPPDVLPWLPSVLDAHLHGAARFTELVDGRDGLRSLF